MDGKGAGIGCGTLIAIGILIALFQGTCDDDKSAEIARRKQLKAEADAAAAVAVKPPPVQAAPAPPTKWNQLKPPEVCARLHAMWDDGWGGDRDKLPPDFRELQWQANLPTIDSECLKPWVPELVKVAKSVDRDSDMWSFGPDTWAFIFNATGDEKYRKPYEKAAARYERENAKFLAQQVKREAKEAAAIEGRSDAAFGVRRYMEANGFNGAIVGATGVRNGTLFIQHEDLTREIIGALALQGLFDVAKKYGFDRIECTNGKLLSHKSWTFAVP